MYEDILGLYGGHVYIHVILVHFMYFHALVLPASFPFGLARGCGTTRFECPV